MFFRLSKKDDILITNKMNVTELTNGVYPECHWIISFMVYAFLVVNLSSIRWSLKNLTKAFNYQGCSQPWYTRRGKEKRPSLYKETALVFEFLCNWEWSMNKTLGSGCRLSCTLMRSMVPSLLHPRKVSLYALLSSIEYLPWFHGMKRSLSVILSGFSSFQGWKVNV